LNIRTNAIHTFSFQLQNALRKYDGRLRPMDRIVVEMKRVSWVRVFSGYLNNGPIFSVWPRVLNITASCTLKRLQFWYWDSTTTKAYTLIVDTMIKGTATTGGNNAATPPSTQAPGAGGVTGQDLKVRDTAVRVLTEVVGWPQEKIHIAEVPPAWYKLAESLYGLVSKNVEVSSALIGDFTSGGTVGGSSVNGAGGLANGTLSPGNYGGVNFSAEQAANAAIIYNVAAGRGLPAKAAIIAIATALQESTLKNLNYGDRDSLGLFQQRPSQGWGTPAQVTDPVYSAGKFYDGLVKVPGWESLPVTVAAQRVQRSAFPNAYAKWESAATAAVGVLSKTGTPGATGAPVAGAPGANVNTGVGGAAVGSGRNVALVAANLIKSRPPGAIRYRLGGDDPYTHPSPTVLDCSSLVDWVYYNAIGRPIQSGRTTAAFQQNWSRGTAIDVATAKNVKGALLFIGSPAHHVEVSLGNGMTAGAHTDGIPLERQVTVGPAGSGWTGAALMPGVDYKDAATTQAAAAVVSKVINQPTTVSDPNETGTGTLAGGAGGAGGAAAGPDGNAAFNAFVNVYVWGFQRSYTGDLLSGARALMNDEPMLPWISNLMATIMRSWCSAPNGDFMAWFPDYFGLWDSAAKMNVKSIELQDFTVEWYDQEIVTHQYVVGVPMAMFDTRTATVTASQGGAGSGSGLYWMMSTQGVATMDFPEIFQAVFGITASQQFVNEYLDRFGGRPNVINAPTIRWNSGAEFFMALYLFMQRWANQFRADVPMTFMPELWPGMLLVLPEFQFQAYILEVNHTFQFGPGGGFSTRAKICAPARTSKKTDIFGLLPLAGSAR
jgi:cell wall-associated NlpC family hydrolase